MLLFAFRFGSFFVFRFFILFHFWFVRFFVAAIKCLNTIIFFFINYSTVIVCDTSHFHTVATSLICSFRFVDDLSFFSFFVTFTIGVKCLQLQHQDGWRFCWHCNVSSKCEKKKIGDIYINTNKKCARKYEMSRKAAQQQKWQKKRELCKIIQKFHIMQTKRGAKEHGEEKKYI